MNTCYQALGRLLLTRIRPDGADNLPEWQPRDKKFDNIREIVKTHPTFYPPSGISTAGDEMDTTPPPTAGPTRRDSAKTVKSTDFLLINFGGSLISGYGGDRTIENKAVCDTGWHSRMVVLR